MPAELHPDIAGRLLCRAFWKLVGTAGSGAGGCGARMLGGAGATEEASTAPPGHRDDDAFPCAWAAASSAPVVFIAAGEPDR